MVPTQAIALVGLLLVGLAILAAGLSVAAAGIGRVRTARTLGETGPVPLAEVPDAGGLVEFTGTTRVGAESLEAPLSGASCLGYSVESRTRERGADEWSLDGRASAGVPFVVADGDDRVTVDPANAVLSLGARDATSAPIPTDAPPEWNAATDGADWTDREALSPDALARLESLGLPVSGTDRASDRVGDGIDGTGDETVDASDATRQYRERRLEPGTEVHVFGGVVEASGSGGESDTDAPVTVEGDDWFEIAAGRATDGRSSVAADRYRSGSMYVIFGGLLAVPGTGLTLAAIVGLMSVLLL